MTTTTDKDAPITLSTGRTVTFKREENGSRTASIGGTATENGEQMTEAEWQELCAIFKEENAKSAVKVRELKRKAREEWIAAHPHA